MENIQSSQPINWIKVVVPDTGEEYYVSQEGFISLKNLLVSSATSASYALTASYALNGGGGGGGSGSTDTGSLLKTASFSNPNLVFTKGNGSTFNVNISSLVITSASYAQSASIANNALTASFASQVLSSSYAQTASNADLATQASTFNILNTPSTAGTYYPVFVNNTSGYLTGRIDSSTFTYDSVANTLTVTSSNAVSASFATTASYVLNAVSSSFASTASFVRNAQTASYVLNAISSSFATTSSIANNAVNVNITDNPSYGGVTFYPTFVSSTSGPTNLQTDSSVFTYNPNTNTLNTTASYATNAESSSRAISASFANTASLANTASYTVVSLSSSYALTAAAAALSISSSYSLTSTSASYALTSSYSLNSITPTGGEGAIQFLFGSGIAGSNRFTFDSNNNIVNINNGATLNATGSLLGTSSFALLTSTASVASTALTTRTTTNATYFPIFVDSSNGSPTSETLWSSTGNITLNPGLGSISATSFTGSLLGTASYATQALSASYFSGSISNAISSSYAVTASHAIRALSASYFSGSISNAISSSYALTASYALNGGGGSGFPYTGNAVITGSLEVTNGITGSLLGTASYAGIAYEAEQIRTFRNSDDGTFYLSFVVNNNTQPLREQLYTIDSVTINPGSGVVSAPTFQGDLSGNASSAYSSIVAITAYTASYVLNAVSASRATTASFVTNLNQTVTLGNVTSTPSTEATLNIYPPIISGTGEGGQLMLAASGGLYTSASMLDTYQNYFRILRGTNTGGSNAQLIGLDLQTGNLSVAGAVSPSTWTAGQVIKDTILSNTEVTISTTTIATSTSDTDFLTYSYTPVSSTSYLIIHYHLSDYSFETGTGNDSYFSRIKVDGTEITYGNQSTVNGFRTGVLFPLMGRYTNSNTTAKSIVVAARRDSADDSITIANTATSMWLRITEIAR